MVADARGRGRSAQARARARAARALRGGCAVPSPRGAAASTIGRTSSHASAPMTTTALPLHASLLRRPSGRRARARAGTSRARAARGCRRRPTRGARASCAAASHRVAHHRHAPEDADDRAPLEQGEVRRDARNVARREADDEEAPFPRRRAQRRLGERTADRIVDHVGARRRRSAP